MDTDDVLLREVGEQNLDVFFEQQRDPAAVWMAAFTPADRSDYAAFRTRWRRILNDPSVTARTILWGGRVVGHVAMFGPPGEREITYWLGRERWGGGLAARALSQFLRGQPAGVVYARAAADNTASLRVLAKCGFTVSGRDRSFAHGRGEEVEEVILKLDNGVPPTPGPMGHVQ